jgi:hypothetical protein
MAEEQMPHEFMSSLRATNDIVSFMKKEGEQSTKNHNTSQIMGAPKGNRTKEDKPLTVTLDKLKHGVAMKASSPVVRTESAAPEPAVLGRRGSAFLKQFIKENSSSFSAILERRKSCSAEDLPRRYRRNTHVLNVAREQQSTCQPPTCVSRNTWQQMDFSVQKPSPLKAFKQEQKCKPPLPKLPDHSDDHVSPGNDHTSPRKQEHPRQAGAAIAFFSLVTRSSIAGLPLSLLLLQYWSKMPLLRR